MRLENRCKKSHRNYPEDWPEIVLLVDHVIERPLFSNIIYQQYYLWAFDISYLKSKKLFNILAMNCWKGWWNTGTPASVAQKKNKRRPAIVKSFYHELTSRGEKKTDSVILLDIIEKHRVGDGLPGHVINNINCIISGCLFMGVRKIVSHLMVELFATPNHKSC